MGTHRAYFQIAAVKNKKKFDKGKGQDYGDYAMNPYKCTHHMSMWNTKTAWKVCSACKPLKMTKSLTIWNVKSTSRSYNNKNTNLHGASIRVVRATALMSCHTHTHTTCGKFLEIAAFLQSHITKFISHFPIFFWHVLSPKSVLNYFQIW